MKPCLRNIGEVASTDIRDTLEKEIMKTIPLIFLMFMLIAPTFLSAASAALDDEKVEDVLSESGIRGDEDFMFLTEEELYEQINTSITTTKQYLGKLREALTTIVMTDAIF